MKKLITVFVADLIFIILLAQIAIAEVYTVQQILNRVYDGDSLSTTLSEQQVFNSVFDEDNDALRLSIAGFTWDADNERFEVDNELLVPTITTSASDGVAGGLKLPINSAQPVVGAKTGIYAHGDYVYFVDSASSPVEGVTGNFALPIFALNHTYTPTVTYLGYNFTTPSSSTDRFGKTILAAITATHCLSPTALAKPVSETYMTNARMFMDESQRNTWTTKSLLNSFANLAYQTKIKNMAKCPSATSFYPFKQFNYYDRTATLGSAFSSCAELPILPCPFGNPAGVTQTASYGYCENWDRSGLIGGNIISATNAIISALTLTGMIPAHSGFTARPLTATTWLKRDGGRNVIEQCAYNTTGFIGSRVIYGGPTFDYVWGSLTNVQPSFSPIINPITTTCSTGITLTFYMKALPRNIEGDANFYRNGVFLFDYNMKNSFFMGQAGASSNYIQTQVKTAPSSVDIGHTTAVDSTSDYHKYELIFGKGGGFKASVNNTVVLQAATHTSLLKYSRGVGLAFVSYPHKVLGSAKLRIGETGIRIY